MYDNNCESYWELSDYLPFNAVVNYWCANNQSCIEPKRHALLSALERGDVKFQRSDGKTFEDPIYDLYQRELILVERESFLAWSKKISNETEKQNLRDSIAVGLRSETTYLNIIGAMLKLIIKQSTNEQHAALNNQSNIINALLEDNDNIQGISQRTLEAKFSAANRELKSN